MRRDVSLLAFVLLAACRADVKKDAITAGPGTGLDVSALRDQIVESSSPASPAWIETDSQQGPSEIAFIGRAEAPSMDAAKALALRDLYAAISSFVAVDVESSASDTQTTEGQEVVEKLKTHASAALREINPDEHYWQRTVASPLAPGDAKFRYWVHAWVPRAEIARARVQRQTEREQKTNRKSIAILPFAGTDVIAGGMAEDLGRILAERRGLHVGDPAMVRAVLPGGGGATELERVERVQDALLPDYVITGAFRRDGDRVKITAVAYDGREGRALRSRAVERPYREVERLQRQLADAIAADLGAKEAAPVSKTAHAEAAKKKDTDAEALEAYHDAYRLYQSGANDKALERIRRAIELRSDDPASYMRMGRILERLGRYARLPPSQAVLQQSAQDISLCTVQARTQAERAQVFLRERATKLYGPAAATPAARGEPWWSNDTMMIDPLLDAAAFAPLPRESLPLTLGRMVRVKSNVPERYHPYYEQYGFSRILAAGTTAGISGTTPDGMWLQLYHAEIGQAGWVKRDEVELTMEFAPWAPPAMSPANFRRGPRSQSAAEAYYEARFSAEAKDDLRGAMQAELALADLAVRVDRLDHGYSLYLEVEERALEELDDHFVSLARAGQAAVLRQLGDLPGAKAKLLAALGSRLLLGEKPYLLEIYNSLGGLAVEMGNYAEAEAWYKRAQRIAGELGNDYLKAVLANNVGVLEHHRGLESAAIDHVEDALERLTGFGEAEGRMASGLNAALLRHTRGDPLAAANAIEDVAKLVGETAQEGRLGELAAKRGALAAARGDFESAEYQLSLALLLFRGLGRPVQVARMQNNLLAVEAAAATDADEDVFECLKSTYWGMGSVVFIAPRMDPNTPTLATLPTDVFQDHELVIALNAATISALDGWRPTSQYVMQRPPPRTFVDKRKQAPRFPVRPPPIPVPHQYEEDALRVERQAEPREAPRPTAEDRAGSAMRETIEIVSQVPGAAGDTLLKAEAPPEPLVSQKPAEYERILGAFIADADVFVWIDPRLANESLDSAAARIAQRMLFAAVRHFENRGAPRPKAVALLNFGALEWSGGRPVSGYQKMMEAQKIFAELGDIEGLAHAYEWLGYVFRESGEAQLASDHLALSHALYRKLEDGAGVERVLSYGSGESAALR